MTETLDQFTRRLSDSGLLSTEQLETFCARLPEDQQPQAADQLSRRLVENNLLTEFQVDALETGDPDPLVIGDYVIQERIGEGGMGIVFKAQHRLMKRTVAVKKLSPKVCQDDSALRRFEREVEISASLNHLNIVAALDARQQQGAHYLVMEYVNGRPLSTIVDDLGPLPVEKAVHYIQQVATGCAHAHDLGVIHRDIKPSNVVVDADDVVKILDMGLARTDTSVNEHLATTHHQLTSAGIIIGTLDYMSPEQALNAREADHRTDIYSLGCTLYFLLTGQPMYGGDTPMEKLVAHREQPIPVLSDARPDVPAELNEIYARLVAKQAGDRFQSMSEVVQALQTCLPSRDNTIPVAEVDVVPATPVAAEFVEPAVQASAAQEPTTGSAGPGVAESSEAVAPIPTRSRATEPRAARSGVFVGLLRTPVVIAGRLGGAIIGGFVGADIGGLIGVFPAIAAAVFYVWFGWRCGGGYAWMISWLQGWTPVRPEVPAGKLFAIEKLRAHGMAILIGGIVGALTGGLWRGIYIGITVLALADQVQERSSGN